MSENENQEPTLEELQTFADTKLAEYKKLKETLATAFDEYEESIIEEQLEEYRKVIRAAKAKIREIQADDQVLA